MSSWAICSDVHFVRLSRSKENTGEHTAGLQRVLERCDGRLASTVPDENLRNAWPVCQSHYFKEYHMNLQELPRESIVCDPDQPRKEQDSRSDEELLLSLKQRGQLVPVIVVPHEGGYTLIDGERRHRMAGKIGLTKLRAVVLAERPEPGELLAIQLSVNSHRTDINPLDRMHAYRKLMELKNISATELAAFLGVSKSSVTRCLALERLSPNVQKLVAEGQISSSNAYALARIEGQSTDQLVESLVGGSLKREQLEKLAGARNPDRQMDRARLVCQLPAGTVSVQTSEQLSLDGILKICSQLIRAIRKAKREGYDVKTLAQMFKDQLTHEKAGASC